MDISNSGSHPALLPATWQVPQVFRHRLGNKVGRQRIMQADGHLLIILHAPPDSEDQERAGRIFWRDPQGNWMPKGLRHGDSALAELIAEYDRVIDDLDERENTASSAEEYFEILKDLNPLTRSANNLHDTLQKAREAMPDDRQLLVLRDSAYAMARRVEILAADTRHGLDYQIALRAEHQAEHAEQMAIASHRLNLLVAFFFPIATLAGIFGMNLYNPLEEWSEKTGAFYLILVLVIGLAMGFVLTGFVTRPVPENQKRKNRKKA